MTTSQFLTALRRFLALHGIKQGEELTDEQKAKLKAIPAQSFTDWLAKYTGKTNGQ